MVSKQEQTLLDELMKFLSSLRQTQKPYLLKQTDLRRRTLRLIDLYNGYQQNHLNAALDAQFAKPRNMKLQLATLNITEYITDQIANYLKNGLTITAENDKDQAIVDEICNDNHADLFWQQLAKYVFLIKTAFVKVSWREDKVALDLMGPQYVTVSTNDDDVAKMTGIVYPKTIVRFDNFRPIGTYCYWDFETFKLLNENGREIPNPDNPDNKNPYGLIPIVPFREIDPVDGFFVWPPDDLDIAQTNTNILRTYINYLIKMQSFSQIVITNPGSKDSVIVVDPSMPIILYDKPEIKSKFEFVTPAPAIKEVREAMESILMEVFSVYGLNASDFVATKQVKSGESQYAQQAKLQEYRDTAKLMFVNQMHDLWDVIRTVWNTHTPGNQLSDAELVFRIVDAPIMPDKVDDRIKIRDWELEHDLTTLPEVMVEEEEDLTLEEAEERIMENRETNDRLKKVVEQPSGSQSGNVLIPNGQDSGSMMPRTQNLSQMPMGNSDQPVEYVSKGNNKPQQ